MKRSDPFYSEEISFLIAIYDCGAIAKAGEKFSLSAPASSRLLDKFRKYFQDPLFVVSRGKLLPTAFFMSILPQLEDLLELYQTLKGKPFDLKACTRNFRFSCSMGFAPLIMAFVLPKLLKEAPKTSIEHVSITSNPINALMGGEIDLLLGRAIGLPPQAHVVSFENVGTRCILLRKGHPLIAKANGQIPNKRLISNYPRVSLFSGRRRDWTSPDKGLINLTSKNSLPLFRTDRADMAWMAMTKTDLIQISTLGSSKVAVELYPELTVLPLEKNNSKAPKISLIWSDSTHRDPALQWLRKLFIEWGQTFNF